MELLAAQPSKGVRYLSGPPARSLPRRSRTRAPGRRKFKAHPRLELSKNHDVAANSHPAARTPRPAGRPSSQSLWRERAGATRVVCPPGGAVRRVAGPAVLEGGGVLGEHGGQQAGRGRKAAGRAEMRERAGRCGAEGAAEGPRGEGVAGGQTAGDTRREG